MRKELKQIDHEGDNLCNAGRRLVSIAERCYALGHSSLAMEIADVAEEMLTSLGKINKAVKNATGEKSYE